jgi:hypothetical protein
MRIGAFKKHLAVVKSLSTFMDKQCEPMSERYLQNGKAILDTSRMNLNGTSLTTEELHQRQADDAARWQRIVESLLVEDEIRSRLKKREIA